MNAMSYQIYLFIVGVFYDSFCLLNYLFPQESVISENVFLDHLQFARRCSFFME